MPIDWDWDGGTGGWRDKAKCMQECLGFNPSAVQIAACIGICAFA